MSKYRFQTTITIYGYIEREIGDQDPDEYAEELEADMPTANDLTFIRDHEVEINDFDEVKS